MKKVLVWSIIIIFALGMLTAIFSSRAAEAETLCKPGVQKGYYEESYDKYLKENGYNGSMASKEIKVDIFSYKASEDMKAINEQDGIITGISGSIKWNIKVQEAGFYNIQVKYMPIEGTNSKIERKLYIDDKSLFKGMNQIVFNRLWDNNDGKTMVEKSGNEIRPLSVEKPEWTSVYIGDSQKRDPEAYKFFLTAGSHTLTFESVKEGFKIGAITLKTAPTAKPYSEVIKEWQSKYKVYEGVNLLYQAERIDENTKAITKSSQDIIMSTDYSSPATIPYHPYKIKLNTIGGRNWRVPGDFITWQINVPEEGLYKLSFRGKQNTNRGVMSYRQIKINGEVPFEEAGSISFGFHSGFVNFVPGDDNGKFLFHFNKGANTISLETVLGNFAMPLSEVEKSLFSLNELYRKTIQITGLVPDKYIDYEITKKIPEFSEVLKGESERLKKVVDELVRITGEKGEKTVIIEKMQLQAQGLSSKPENVINELATLQSNISALGNWVTSISEMPLELDSFTLASTNSKLDKPEANIAARAYYGAVRFFSTFFVDETKITETTEKKSIKVWISAGRDQAQIIKNQIDQSFTPESGIPVDLQLIPQDVILPATLAGNGPDVALNLPQATVLNFAMRNALVDLSKLEGFGEVKKNFYDSAVNTVTYQNGVYGLPEQQSFMMLFYRKDILDSLGLEPPKTWEEVEETISVLHTNNYDFYIPGINIYPSLVFQYGGNMYKGTGVDYGIESGLSDDRAMAAFNNLTKFFTSYRLPVTADFANRFRNGEMPVGIAPYTLYNQLEVFAPEIRGMWSFMPLPGVKDSTGKVNNTAVADTINSVMMDTTEDKASAWKFMKWWLDTNTQTQYANSLEAVMGTSARYPTANINVLKQLPWPQKQSEKLMEQFNATIGVPEVPGGYLTTRSVDYAFRSVVTSGQNPREALFMNIKQIDKEIVKKRKEFHLSYIESN